MNEHLQIENHGSIVLIRPVSDFAIDWLEAHCLASQWWAGGVVVEPRYVRDLVAGFRADLVSELDYLEA